MKTFGFAGGSSKTQVDAAIEAFHRLENLMETLSTEEKEQVFDSMAICYTCGFPPLRNMMMWELDVDKWENEEKEE